MVTALIFFALGFLLAGLVNFSVTGSDDESQDNSPTVVSESNSANFGAVATLDLSDVDDPIAAAVEGTLIALTPRVPIETTYQSTNFFLGNDEAPIVMVEFSDFGCPYCARHATQTVDLLVDHYGDLLKYVYRNHIIFGPDSLLAARASNCAGNQGHFWEYHNLLFGSRAVQPPMEFNDENLVGIAETLELDIDAYEACMNDSGEAQAVVDDATAASQLIGRQGTPTFTINGQLVTAGAQDFEYFQQIIDAELRRLGIDPPA